jgi:hypothetical protein
MEEEQKKLEDAQRQAVEADMVAEELSQMEGAA